MLQLPAQPKRRSEKAEALLQRSWRPRAGMLSRLSRPVEEPLVEAPFRQPLHPLWSLFREPGSARCFPLAHLRTPPRSGQAGCAQQEQIGAAASTEAAQPRVMLDVLRKRKGGARKSIWCGSNEFLSVLVFVVIFGPDDWACGSKRGSCRPRTPSTNPVPAGRRPPRAWSRRDWWRHDADDQAQEGRAADKTEVSRSVAWSLGTWMPRVRRG